MLQLTPYRTEAIRSEADTASDGAFRRILQRRRMGLDDYLDTTIEELVRREQAGMYTFSAARGFELSLP